MKLHEHDNFVPLLNEGTTVGRAIVATAVEYGRYRITSEPSDDEEWAFATGTTVIIDCDRQIIGVATA